MDYEKYTPTQIPTRPGSNDAFTKPSRVGDKLIPYSAKSTGLVGKLKDSKKHHND
jgi:hypothetical protein